MHHFLNSESNDDSGDLEDARQCRNLSSVLENSLAIPSLFSLLEYLLITILNNHLIILNLYFLKAQHMGKNQKVITQ